VQISGVQSAGPVRASENLLQHEGVDEHHAVLEQVQAEHAQLLVLALVARELAAAANKRAISSSARNLMVSVGERVIAAAYA
jgi:hypothetical protein